MANIRDGLGKIDELADDAVDTVEIADDQITTAKILDDNVTFEKLEKGIDSGRETISTDGSGDGTLAVTFSETFTASPALVLSLGTNDDTAIFNYSNISSAGFHAHIDAAAATSSSVGFSWMAREV